VAEAPKKAAPKGGGMMSKKVFGFVPLPIAVLAGGGLLYLLYRKYEASKSTAASTTAAAAATPTDTGTGAGTDTGSDGGYSGGGGSGGFGGSQGGGLAASLAAIEASIAALQAGGQPPQQPGPAPTPPPSTPGTGNGGVTEGKVAPCPPGYSRATAGSASSPCVKIPVKVSAKPVTTTPVKTGGTVKKPTTPASPTKTYPVQVRS